MPVPYSARVLSASQYGRGEAAARNFQLSLSQRDHACERDKVVLLDGDRHAGGEYRQNPRHRRRRYVRANVYDPSRR